MTDHVTIGYEKREHISKRAAQPHSNSDHAEFGLGPVLKSKITLRHARAGGASSNRRGHEFRNGDCDDPHQSPAARCRRFPLLMEQEPRIAERVHAVVRERVGRDVVSPKGDIVAGELAGATEGP
jgi:hypothetical protein